jgi:hypothetical protein
MDLSQQQRLFSEAYVKAVAATAGYSTYVPSVDDDSVDIGIAARGPYGTRRAPHLELQLKTYLVDDLPSGTDWSYPELKLKNYNDLRHTDFAVPRILVVVRMPKDTLNWLGHTVSSLALKHCGYWASLYGDPDTSNKKKITVHMPLSQMFSVDQLTGMMERIGKGGLP